MDGNKKDFHIPPIRESDNDNVVGALANALRRWSTSNGHNTNTSSDSRLDSSTVPAAAQNSNISSNVLPVLPIPRQEQWNPNTSVNAPRFRSAKQEFKAKLLSTIQHEPVPTCYDLVPPPAFGLDQYSSLDGYYHDFSPIGIPLQNEAAAYPVCCDAPANVHQEHWGSNVYQAGDGEHDINSIGAGLTGLSLTQGPLYTAADHNKINRSEVIALLNSLQEEVGRGNIALSRRIDEMNSRLNALEEARASNDESNRLDFTGQSLQKSLQNFSTSFGESRGEEQERLSTSGASLQQLNNKVPPGTRANNYLDNFRSYSHQNLLSIPNKNVPSSSRDASSVGSSSSSLSGAHKSPRNRLREVEVLMNIGKKHSNMDLDHHHHHGIRQPRSFGRRNEMANRQRPTNGVSPNIRSRSPPRDSSESNISESVQEMLKVMIDLMSLFMKKNATRPGYITTVLQKLVSIQNDYDRLKVLESVMAITPTTVENDEFPEEDFENSSVIWKEPIVEFANSMEESVRSFQSASLRNERRRRRESEESNYQNNLSVSQRSRYEDDVFDLAPLPSAQFGRYDVPSLTTGTLPPNVESSTPVLSPLSNTIIQSINVGGGSGSTNDNTVVKEEGDDDAVMEGRSDQSLLEHIRQNLIRFQQDCAEVDDRIGAVTDNDTEDAVEECGKAN